MAIGSLGGLGGRAMSYPTRMAAPESAPVDYLQNYNDWNAAWQAERDALKGSPIYGQVQSSPGWGNVNGPAPSPAPDPVAPPPAVYMPSVSSGGPVSGSGGPAAPQPGSGWAPSAPYAGYGNNYSVGGGMDALNTFLQQSPIINKMPEYPFTQSAESSPTIIGYSAPDYTASDAARAAMMPKYENQTRQQQAYDSMRGWGQNNAVMGPDYTSPTFGQINGQVNGDPGIGQGSNAGAGVNSTANGVFSPSQSSVGVYGNPRRSSNWGLF